MKKIIVITATALLLLTGCTNEVKESKSESKKVVHNIKEIRKESVDAFEPLTDSEAIYMKTIQKFITTYSERVNDIQKHTHQPIENPSIANDEKWRNELSGDFMAIYTIANLMEEMSQDNAVPSRFLTLHQNAIDCFKLMSNGGERLMYSIRNNLDTESLNESMQLMAESNIKLKLVNDELDVIQKEVK